MLANFTSTAIGYNQRLLAASLLAIVFIGVFFRFYGLGFAPLAVDEYYFTKAVTFILDKGIPEFAAGGGYYTRGLLQQYGTALLLIMGLPLEWGVRLIPAIAGVAAMFGCFYLSRLVGGQRVALVATFLLSLSLWQIEFSRFGRMYAPFQALFLWYLYFFIKGVDENRWQPIVAAYSLSLLSIGIHSEAFFLLIFNFMPLFLMKRINWGRTLIIPILLIGCFFYYHSFSFVDTEPRLPPSIASHPIAPDDIGALLPPLLHAHLLDAPLFLALYFLLASASGIALWKLITHKQRFELWSLALCVAIVSALCNQLGFAIVSLITGLLLNSAAAQQKLERPNVTSLISLIVAHIGFWVIYGLTNDNWYGATSNLDIKAHPGISVQLISILFNYPDFVTRFLKPLFMPMPFTILISLASALTLILLAITKPKMVSNNYRPLLLLFIGGTALVSLVNTDQKISRYSFFLYPLLVIFVAQCTVLAANICKNETAKLASIAILTSLFFSVSEDFSFKHLAKINNPDYKYRTSYTLELQNHYYPRRDFRTPAEFINRRIKSGELLVSEVSPIELYLKHPIDYIYLPMEQKRFWSRAVLNATKDRWTGSNLVYRLDNLHSLLDNNEQAIWLIAFSQNWYNEPIKTFREAAPLSLRYENEDKTIDVFYLPAKSKLPGLVGYYKHSN